MLSNRMAIRRSRRWQIFDEKQFLSPKQDLRGLYHNIPLERACPDAGCPLLLSLNSAIPGRGRVCSTCSVLRVFSEHLKVTILSPGNSLQSHETHVS